MRSKYTVTIGLITIVAFAFLGGLFGGRLLATQENIPQYYEQFSTALAGIESNYVEEVDTAILVYQAIGGMLQTLDPHSSFMDPKSYAQMRERQEGRYYGLGISINVINGDITVMSLFEGSPAYRTGIRRGDVIARISGQSAKDMTSEEAVSLLRGPKGTAVNISLRRVGYDNFIEMAVERDEISIATIESAFLADNDVGYVKLGDFSETTNRDLTAALKMLRGEGMKRLLLDLRNNPGGPLDQTINVSNQFLP